MSDDEPYDADGDVSRFLSCHSPEAHLFSLSEPEGTLEGLFQPPAPTDEHVGQEGNPAPPIINAAEHYGAPPIMNAERYGAAQIMNAEQYEAPGINGEHHQATAMETGQYQAMDMDVQATRMLAPGMQQGYGFPTDPTLVQGNGVHGEHYQAPMIMDAHHFQAPTINSEDHEAPPIHDEHYQHHAAIINAGSLEAVAGMMAMGVLQPATNTMPPEMTHQMQQAYGNFPDPTPPIQHGGGGGNGEHYHQVLPIMDSQYFQAPTIDSDHREAPPMHAEHHQAAIVDAQHYQAPTTTMAMDIVQPATNTLLDPDTMMMQMQQAYGAFPDPTPAVQQVAGGGGVDAASSLMAGDSMMLRPPSPTLYEMMDELAAMLQAGGVDMSNDGVAAVADGDARDVFPAADAEDDDVVFEPIVRGQLDCSRCRPTREILDDIGTRKTYFAVHSTYPGTFEHAIVDSMAIGADGQFHSNELLYCDLRGRSLEWVQNFIAKNVDKMKNSGRQPQDICGPSNAGGQPQDICGPSNANNNIIAPPRPPSNNIAPMELDNHEHMALEIDMLNNILLGTAAQAAHSEEAAEPAEQAEENTDAPPSVVEEEPVTEAAQSSGVVTQAQENTTDAPPSVAEAAATTEAEAAPPESAQPSVTQAQENNDAGAVPPVADVAAAAPEAPEPVTFRGEPNTNAGENFAAFNWEGFMPNILESSQVQPYDPASGVNVLMYPSLLEQLSQQELKKQERTRLSNMSVTDTPDYLNINDDHYANAPNFASETFKLLCLRDPTYRLYKTRVSGLCRKIKKLEQKATQVGTGGLFAIKQKMESFKLEKEKIYATIKSAMQGNGKRSDSGSTNNGEGPSNINAEPSNGGEGPSNVAAATSNKNAAGPASSAAGPSNVAGPSGTK